MIRQPIYASFLLQTTEVAPVASFDRQCNYGYISSQELTTETHLSDFRYRKDT